MRRTRKWSYVQQEARRLAALGLSGYELAKQLEVNESTISRWVAAGKLKLRGGRGGEIDGNRKTVAKEAVTTQSPAEWAAAVRATYALDATDDQLVTMAERALATALSTRGKPSTRLSAMGRFQALVKQLRLVARTETQQPPAPATEVPKRKTFTLPKRSGTDPRALLTAVK